MEERVVARWEAKGGKRWLELKHDELGYTYTGGNSHSVYSSCGTLPKLVDDDAAIAYMERPWGNNGAGPVTVLATDFPSVKRVR